MRLPLSAMLLWCLLPWGAEATAHPPGAGVADVPAGNRQEAFCGRCHPDTVRHGHPTGIVPRSPPPAPFGLDGEGRLTCGTCHGTGAAPTAAPGCGACHDAAFFSAMADDGMSLAGRAHDPQVHGGAVDLAASASLPCLDCHAEHGLPNDGTGLLRVGMGAGARANHPVGRPYRLAVARGGYLPEALLPAELRLPDGRLSCVTCHRSYSARHGATVLPTAGSRLCFGCHEM